MAMPADYLALCSRRFPTVVLAENGSVPSFGHDPVLDAFCVPDDAMAAFTRFLIDDFPDMVEAERLEPVTIIAHSETSTRLYYPQMFNACLLQFGEAFLAGGDEPTWSTIGGGAHAG